MADDRETEPEGWGVPFRTGMISALAVPVALGIAVFAAGVIYDRTLRHQVQFSVTRQPAPGLETSIHAGARDPELAMPTPLADRAIERAKKEAATEGLSGWVRNRR